MSPVVEYAFKGECSFFNAARELPRQNSLRLISQKIDADVKTISGCSFQQILDALLGLKEELRLVKNWYPARLNQELAGKLGISVNKAVALIDFLEQSGIISYYRNITSTRAGRQNTFLEILPCAYSLAEAIN